MGSTSQEMQISDIFLQNLKNVIYCTVVFFTLILNLIHVGIVHIPLKLCVSTCFTVVAKRFEHLVLFEKSSAKRFGCFLSMSFCLIHFVIKFCKGLYSGSTE